jgi:RHS repeat-associated protein
MISVVTHHFVSTTNASLAALPISAGIDQMMYYRARYYMPGCARFISEDPIGWASGQTNNYAYVGGDPVSYSDPSGNLAFIPVIIWTVRAGVTAYGVYSGYQGGNKAWNEYVDGKCAIDQEFDKRADQPDWIPQSQRQAKVAAEFANDIGSFGEITAKATWRAIAISTVAGGKIGLGASVGASAIGVAVGAYSRGFSCTK